MAEPGGNAHNSENAQREAAHRRSPEQGIAEQREGDAPDNRDTSVAAEVKARIMYVHKGDVGRPGVNEEIFQGSKMRELK